MVNSSSKKTIKFFPLATSRLLSFTNYLNMMYSNGYKIVDIIFDCILVFEKTTVKAGYSYYVLTEHFTRREAKWDDIKFLEEKISNFYNSNGEQLKKFDAFVNVYYYIYFSKDISNREYQSLCDFRKKHIRRSNIQRLTIYFLFVILYPSFLIYKHFH